MPLAATPASDPQRPRTARRLVLGGARSGKSTWAESQFVDRATVDYVATSVDDPTDAEWVERLKIHRERRPASWRTIETTDVASVLLADDEAPVLVDCLAVWLARMLDEVDAWTPGIDYADTLRTRTDTLVDAVARSTRDVILVSNEVGLGIVPDNAGGRLYRDELGRLNARVAAVCDELWWCLAGVAKRWM